MSKGIKTDYHEKIKEINQQIEKLENEKRIINGKLKVLITQKEGLKAKMK